MKIYILAISIGLIFGSLVSNIKKIEFSPSLTYDEAHNITSNGIWFINLYTPNCKYCKLLEPIWKEVSIETYNWALMNDFHFAKINCRDEPELCSEFKANGHPTLNLFKDGVYQKECLRSESFKGLISCINDISEEYSLSPVTFNSPVIDPYTGKSVYPEPMYAKKGLKTSLKEEASIKKQEYLGFNKIIIDLDQSNFNSAFSGKWFVNFYSPWCPYSEKLIPEWNSLSTLDQDKFNVATVNCDIERKLCKNIGIMGFPTLIYFRDGIMIEYSGKKNFQSLYSFINNIDKENSPKDYVHKVFPYYSLLAIFMFIVIIQILRNVFNRQLDTNNTETIKTEGISKSQIIASENSSIAEHRIIVDLNRKYSSC